MITWIIDSWGIAPLSNGKYSVVFGDDETAAHSFIYRNRRAAKKEISHYIAKGLDRGSFHGAYKQLKLING